MFVPFTEEQREAVGVLKEAIGGISGGGYNPTTGAKALLEHAVGLLQESGLLEVKASYVGSKRPRSGGPVAFCVTPET